MAACVSDIQLSELSEFVDNRIGLHFPRERWRDLERGVCNVAEEFGFRDAESCIKWLFESPLTKKQIEMLAGCFTIGETYFFRDKRTFEILEEQVLAALVSSRRGGEQCLRIWSAGCSTGEEPYSIAILLSKMIPDLKDWNITILATDINPHFLRKASDGIYGAWSFRDAPTWIWGYFKKTKSGFEILPFVKEMVSFSYHNLAEDAYPSLLNNTNAMDIIFCRNVLMYFSQERARRVIQNLYRCLVDEGWLIVSPVEAFPVHVSPFAAVNFTGATFYKKSTAESQRIDEIIPEWQCPLHKDITPHPIENFVPEALIISQQEIREPEIKRAETQPFKEAQELYEQGRYALVIEKIGELVLHRCEDSKTIILLARAYANQGKLTEALQWCEKAIAIDRLNPYCYYLRATILQEKGQVEDAVKSLKRALYLDQNFALAHFCLGNLSKQQGKYKESDKSFDNALILLKKFKEDEIMPESEGITAGRLSEIITSMKGREELS